MELASLNDALDACCQEDYLRSSTLEKRTVLHSLELVYSDIGSVAPPTISLPSAVGSGR